MAKRAINTGTGLGAAVTSFFRALWLAGGDLPGKWRRGPAPPSGFDLVLGPKGCGKSLMAATWLMHWRRMFGHGIRILTNCEWRGEGLAALDSQLPEELTWLGEDGAVLTPDDLLRAAVDDRESGTDRRPIVCWIDELQQWIDAYKWQSVDVQFLDFLSQQRHYTTYIVATTQDSAMVMARARMLVDRVWLPRLHLGNRWLVAERFSGAAYFAWRDGLAAGTTEVAAKKKPHSQIVSYAVSDLAARQSYDSWRHLVSLSKRAQDEAGDVDRERGKKNPSPPKGGEGKRGRRKPEPAVS